MSRKIKRGEIYYADLNPVIGSEQGGIRPVLIVQNDVGNKYSPTVIVAPLTSKQKKSPLSTHVSLSSVSAGLSRDSIALLEQIRTIDKSRLYEFVGSLNRKTMRKVNHAIHVSFWKG